MVGYSSWLAQKNMILMNIAHKAAATTNRTNLSWSDVFSSSIDIRLSDWQNRKKKSNGFCRIETALPEHTNQ